MSVLNTNTHIQTNTHRVYIYALNLFIEHSGEHWWERNIFCSFTMPQAFWQSPAPDGLNTLVTSVVLYSQPEPHWWVLGRTKHVSVDIYIICVYVSTNYSKFLPILQVSSKETVLFLLDLSCMQTSLVYLTKQIN